MNKNRLFALVAVVLATVACTKENTPQKKGMTISVSEIATKATFTDGADGKWAFEFEAGDVLTVSNSEAAGQTYYFDYDVDRKAFTCAEALPTEATATWHVEFGFEGKLDGTRESVARAYTMVGDKEFAGGTEELTDIQMTPLVSIIKMKNWGEAFELQVKFADGSYWNGAISLNEGVSVYGKSTEAVGICVMGKEAYSFVPVPAGCKISLVNGDNVIKTTKDAGLTAGKYYTVTLGNGWAVKGAWDNWAEDVAMTELSDGIWVSEAISFTEGNEFKFHLGDTWQGAESTGAYWLGANGSAPFGSENIRCTWEGDHSLVLDFIHSRIYFAYGVCGMIGTDETRNWSDDVLLLNDGTKFYSNSFYANGTEFKLREYGSWANSWGSFDNTLTLGDYYECWYGNDSNIVLPSAGTYSIAEFYPFDTAKGGSNATVKVIQN